MNLETPETTPPAPVRRRRPLYVLGIVLMLFVGIFIGRYLLPAAEFAPNSPLNFVAVEEGKRQLVFPTFWEAWDQLHNKFIGELDDKELFYGAVKGMVQAAGNPYTAFADPAETRQFKENIEGSFSGIGVEIGIRNGLVTVIAPLEGSPAEQAGILAGDIIVSIDGKPIAPEMTIDQVVSQIRGRARTKVKLTVLHKDRGEPVDIEIVRDKIEVESVKSEIKDGIAIIEITNFNADTAGRFDSAARAAKAAQVKGIIVDLRNNPGGFLQSAVDIASAFLPKGQVVVSERGTATEDYLAQGDPVLAEVPVVVLVNGGSASASEILAGALSDQLQVPLVGTKTFGKGSVQEFVELSDGSSLRITVAKWFTPKGRNIDEGGIEPTIVIEENRDTEEDEQLLRAQEELNKLIAEKQGS